MTKKITISAEKKLIALAREKAKREDLQHNQKIYSLTILNPFQQ